jgi:hypothetical protein
MRSERANVSKFGDGIVNTFAIRRKFKRPGMDASHRSRYGTVMIAARMVTMT